MSQVLVPEVSEACFEQHRGVSRCGVALGVAAVLGAPSKSRRLRASMLSNGKINYQRVMLKGTWRPEEDAQLQA
eukprot:359094-Chlamydomonas_euryale.AAC.12